MKHIKAGELPWTEPGGQWTDRFPGWAWKDLHRTHGVEVSLWRLEPGRADESHSHSDGDEHLYIISGEIESDGKRFKAGDYVFRPAG
jgi:quercetin dioxygenase-like cupin family protein